MARLLPFLLPLLVSLILVKFFPWPLPYLELVNSSGLYELNYVNLLVDFFVFFLASLVVLGILDFVLVLAVLKSLFREEEEEERAKGRKPVSE